MIIWTGDSPLGETARTRRLHRLTDVYAPWVRVPPPVHQIYGSSRLNFAPGSDRKSKHEAKFDLPMGGTAPTQIMGTAVDVLGHLHSFIPSTTVWCSATPSRN